MLREIDSLRGLRDKALLALQGKDPSQEEYKTLVEAVERYTKLIQLLEGKPTEITAGTARLMSEEEIEAEIQRLENGETEIRPESGSPAGEAEEGTGETEAN